MAINLVSGSFCQFGFYFGCPTTYTPGPSTLATQNTLTTFWVPNHPIPVKWEAKNDEARTMRSLPVSGSGWKTNKQPTFKPIRPCNMLEDFFHGKAFQRWTTSLLIQVAHRCSNDSCNSVQVAIEAAILKQNENIAACKKHKIFRPDQLQVYLLVFIWIRTSRPFTSKKKSTAIEYSSPVFSCSPHPKLPIF